jgi:hypothetical protein
VLYKNIKGDSTGTLFSGILIPTSGLDIIIVYFINLLEVFSRTASMNYYTSIQCSLFEDKYLFKSAKVFLQITVFNVHFQLISGLPHIYDLRLKTKIAYIRQLAYSIFYCFSSFVNAQTNIVQTTKINNCSTSV